MQISREEICSNFSILAPTALVLIALVIPITNQHLRKLEISFNKVARQKFFSVLLIGLLTFIGAALVSYFFYWPVPTISDEFSYLLAGDTFAHGHLTNPSHPMWVHFETFYVLSQPTYMSLYQPGQGLMLALGQVLTGYPIVGVWFSMALACAATCWMLQAWLPPRWALLGALLMVLKLGLFSYWSQSFWGGAVSAFGGALVYGAMRRIIKQPTTSNALLFAIGLSLLANTRPYEGLIISLPAIGYLLIWAKSKKSPPFKIIFKQIVLPVTVLLGLVIVMMGYYNWAITGKFWQLPYQLYQATYATVSNFLWVKPRLDIKYNHEEFRKMYYEWFINMYNSNIGYSRFFVLLLIKIVAFVKFFLGQQLGVALLALPFLLKNHWVRFALFAYLLLIVGELQIITFIAHYIAPGTCLLYFLILQCLRKIYFWQWKNRPTGKLIIWSIPTYHILLIILPIVVGKDPFFYVNPSPWEPTRTLESNWSVKRANLLTQLSSSQEQSLVIVRYLPDHYVEDEWVYNEANIDKARVVWAREMTPEKNCELIKYFSGRKVWLLEVGSTFNVSLKAYPENLCK